MTINYVASETMTVQGKWDKIVKRYGKEWSINPLGGGNGNGLLTRKSDVLVNRKSYRDFILNHYERYRLTEKLFDKFLNDLLSGKIKLS